MRLWRRAWPPSRIGLRLLAFNLLVVFVPVVGVLYLDVYEAQLLQAQEREMVQQGRMLAAAATASGPLNAEDVTRILLRLGRQSDARFRVYDSSGTLMVDSARIDSVVLATPSAYVYGVSSEPGRGIRQRALYRIGAWLAGARQRLKGVMTLFFRPRSLPPSPDVAAAVAPELRAALAGHYGATTRQTPGQRSLTLFSAVPIRTGDDVVGAIVVSQSTFRVLNAIYVVRLRIFEVVVSSILAAAVLTALAAMTIVKPLRRLRRQAVVLTDRRDPLPPSFPGSGRRDELGDLARALEELARRINEHIGHLEGFAADVSHEFKNPLASIRTAAEMIGQSEHAADREKFLTLMLRDVDRLERLVTGAREAARIDGALETEGLAEVPVVAVVREAIDTVSAAHYGCAIVIDGADDALAVRGSRERLTQVFENLLANAVSFTGRGTAVEVKIVHHDPQCIVTISDRGPGIPAAHMDQIFNRFFSYRPASGRGDHVGLGLSIARRIVEGYGGTIDVANRSGGGATFEVRLPARRLRVGPPHSARNAISGSTLSARRDGI
jgi:two-component system, OmpR family, sensor histidine kinase ChvG